MAKLPVAFDPRSVDPSSGMGPDPDFVGWHQAVITDDELKRNNAGNGQYMQLTISIIDGKFKGRKLWHRLNVDHPNQTAVEIAYRELSAICHAVGWLQDIDDCVVLHNKPFMVNVGYEPPTDKTKGGNEVLGVQALTMGQQAPSPPAPRPQGGKEAPVAAATQATTPTPSPAAPTPATPPWAKKAGGRR